MVLSSTVHTEVVSSTILLLFLVESLEGATGKGTLRRAGSGVVGGGGCSGCSWSSVLTMVLPGRRNGWPGRVTAFQASLVEAVVDADSQLDEGPQLRGSFCSGKFILDRAFETLVELADERLFAPRQQG
jgi:hypothetical protein